MWWNPRERNFEIQMEWLLEFIILSFEIHLGISKRINTHFYVICLGVIHIVKGWNIEKHLGRNMRCSYELEDYFLVTHIVIFCIKSWIIMDWRVDPYPLKYIGLIEPSKRIMFVPIIFYFILLWFAYIAWIINFSWGYLIDHCCSLSHRKRSWFY